MAKAKTKTPAKTNYDRLAIYTGRRISPFSGKTFQRFELLPERSEMLFSGIKGVYIGYTYKCTTSQISIKPERADAERIDNPEWDAGDALVDAKNAQKRAEAKIRASTKPALKAAIIALKPLMRGRDHFERKALIEYLATETRNLK